MLALKNGSILFCFASFGGRFTPTGSIRHSICYISIKRRSISRMCDHHYELVVDDFCLRQFDPDRAFGLLGILPSEFEQKANEHYQQIGKILAPGYANFCKHLFMPNLDVGLLSSTIPVTSENEHLLRSAYEARSEDELPVLTRYFPKEQVRQRGAKYLDVILYSREQIIKENAAMGKESRQEHIGAPWGIISVKAQDVDFELPMQPITMMRNALGREYGGSGVPVDKTEYAKSVEFWSRHAIVR